MKQWMITLSILLTVGFVLAGCSSEGDAASEETKKVKVGLNGSGVPIWEKIKEKAAEENIEIELVEFADYVRPNMALADGDIDLNAFQTVSYFDSFIKEHNLDLAPIGTTLIAPMGIYSEKYEDVSNIPEGSSIAIPKEATNMGRALLLLEESGLIGLPEDFDGNGDLSKIEENPKNLKFEPIVAAQTPRVLPDVAASLINNGVAVEAGFVPVEDAIAIEDETAQPYINIMAARADETDNETYQKIVDIYQAEDVADHIEEVYNQSLIPTFVPLKEIGW
ncbi:D-methionine transport system substrate-binding protein [Halobacillus karajensis]|uniref:Lipoprotein n=1 Tax=Halobacillus karajensis TaxID=195088 RepID=A0A059NYM8_9BACI|nr:MetQ/NlpA family ABC transporter substrate-binding protein [Halobacillus karajensis]CDQ18602.1 D-methionine-binding lipoprotein MetQ precursor [Halobacillus karajensis]CDQ23326.1 D-methionine-binding lipoprotein MetQ precursor [Halobacillus karajensis]CDQ26808.1 D-methionine-binding lipoprotein MetQ precursor [Halobacillus karajensis]SEH49327.1 D-methionine transport system substrate-binding protein [Halobacillus karajensis]